MKRRIVIILILTMVTSLIACSQEDTSLRETVEPLYDGIIHYDNLLAVLQPGYPLRFGYFEVPYQEAQPTAQRQHSDSRLRQMIEEQIPPTVLDSDDAIAAHAWNLEPLLESTYYFPKEHIPVAAATFANNVVLIVYAPPYYVELSELDLRYNKFNQDSTDNNNPDEVYYCTEAEIFVFVSAEDGHVVYIR